jgi:hypothetical protein
LLLTESKTGVLISRFADVEPRQSHRHWSGKSSRIFGFWAVATATQAAWLMKTAGISMLRKLPMTNAGVQFASVCSRV